MFCLIIFNQPSPAAGESLPICKVCCLNPEILFWASPNTSCVFVSFSLHELMTFCSRLPSSSQESRVRPFPTDATPLAEEEIHEIKVKNTKAEKAGGFHLQRGDCSQNEVSKTSVTQIFLWILRNQFRRQGWLGRGSLFSHCYRVCWETQSCHPLSTYFVF